MTRWLVLVGLAPSWNSRAEQLWIRACIALMKKYGTWWVADIYQAARRVRLD